MQRFFSVIMPVYNHESFLQSAVNSVLAQTYPGWELILINDGSRDRSGQLIDDYARTDARIQAIHQDNSGAATARNRAIAAARTDWITYLDSDDIWYPHTLQAYADRLERQPQVRFLYGYADRLQGKQVIRQAGEFQNCAVGTKELFQRSFLRTLSVCHHRSLWESAGGYDTSLSCCEDYEIFLRMSLRCSLQPLGEATGLRRRHDSNLSRPSGRTQPAEAEMLRQFAEANPHVIPANLRARRLGQIYARAARCFVAEADYHNALAMARVARQLTPGLRTTTLYWWSWLRAQLSRQEPIPVNKPLASSVNRAA